MRWRTLALLAALGSAVLPTARGGPARAATAPPFPAFTLSGDGCLGSSAIFAVPIARAQAVVPAPYEVYDYAGLGIAKGAIRVTRCEHVRVDGGTPAPAVFSSVLIDIDPPSAPDESVHQYELWRVDGNSSIRQRFASAGMAGGLVADASLDEVSPAPAQAVAGSVPWERASIDVLHGAPDPTGGLPIRVKESAWHSGALGTFRTFTSSVEAQHAGPAAVQVSGELSSLLGGLPAAVLPGLVRTFSFTARVERVAIARNALVPK